MSGPHKQQIVPEEHQDPERNPGSRHEEGECSAPTMAPVFVLLQDVEETRGGGRPRGPGTVGTTGAPATPAEGLPRHQAASPASGDRSSTKQVGGCFASQESLGGLGCVETAVFFRSDTGEDHVVAASVSSGPPVGLTMATAAKRLETLTVPSTSTANQTLSNRNVLKT